MLFSIGYSLGNGGRRPYFGRTSVGPVVVDDLLQVDARTGRRTSEKLYDSSILNV